MCPIVTLPNGQVRDEIRQPQYDTFDLGAVSPVGTVTFFNTVTNKSLQKTNLKQPGSLPTATSFRVQGLCLDAQNNALLNVGVIPTILIRSSLQLNIGDKIYWQGPSRFASGRMYSDLGGDADDIFQQYGWAAIQPVVFQGRHVIDINPLQNFSVNWVIGDMTAGEVTESTPAANTVVSFVMSLKGLLRRPVQ